MRKVIASSNERRQRLPVALVAALGLHALGYLLIVRQELPSEPRSRHAVPPAELPVEVDVEWGGTSAAELPAGVSSELALSAPVAAHPRFAPPRALARSSEGPKPRGLGEPGPPTPAEVGSEATEDESSAAPDSAPRLSLDALGVGERNPFVGSDLSRAPLEKRPPKRARESAKARLERSLAQEALLADHSRHLGPAGPVLRALEGEVRRGEVAVNSSALLRCSTDASGKVVSVEVSESSSDPTPWRRVARRLLTALAGSQLRVPASQRGVTFSIRVVSREQLPSGADPGIAVSVLGIPVQEGEGDRSARLEILNVLPRFETTPIITESGQTIEVPTLQFGSIFSLAGDPADIGSPAQRMVHAHVEKLELNPE